MASSHLQESKTYKPDSYDLDMWAGRLFIFNNMEFKNLKKRKGSEMDARALTDICTKFKFVPTETFENLSEKKFNKKLEEICEEDYSKSSCLVMAFLTHGNEGRLQMTDYGVCIDVVIKKISEIETLNGKPKILIFQACRGRQIGIKSKKRKKTADGSDSGDEVSDVDDEEKQDEEEEEEGSDFSSAIPLGADFIMCNSTSKNFKSYRNKRTGSRYIQTLCDVLERYAEGPANEEVEFTQLLTQTSLEVAMMNPDNPNRQIPSYTSTLTKLIYLPRKWPTSSPQEL